MEDPTFKTITVVFSKEHPDAVIVEGVDPANKIASFISFARECAAAGYNVAGKGCGEPALTAALADVSGAQVYSGDPPSKSILERLEQAGYTIQDYLAFWVVNYIPFEKRQGSFGDDAFARMVGQVVGYQNYLLGTKVAFGASEFKAWYVSHMRTPENYMDIEVNDTAPGGDTIIHKIASLYDEVRDANVVRTIQEALRTHNCVLVVYGASHLDFEWNVLVKLYGTPVKKKLF
jgi:hypothetical protein